MPQAILPNALKQLRRDKGWTLAELASAAKVDKATIHKIETGKAPRPRLSTIEKLSRALAIDPGVLTGATPPSQPSIREATSARQQFNVRISDAVRNALGLVARRYGIPSAQIVEAAPLLFFLAAERSLQRRQRALDGALQVMKDLWAAGQTLPHLPPGVFDPTTHGELDAEQKSIKARDLFGKQVDEAAFYDRPGYDPDRHNPFVSFLRRELSELTQEAGADAEHDAEVTFWSDSSWPSYRICREEAKSIVGDDELAIDAILDGTAPLNEMPKELRVAPQEERAKWAKGRSDQFFRDFFKEVNV